LSRHGGLLLISLRHVGDHGKEVVLNGRGPMLKLG
jgi:hypothetical protein